MKKKNSLYILILSIWILLLSALWYFFITTFLALDRNMQLYPLILTLLIFNAIFISYFWLNGIKDFVYVVWLSVFKKRMLRAYDLVKQTKLISTPKVLLIYCTCNDFDAQSLLKCMGVKYENFETVILDDSNQQQYKDEIDAFSQKYGVKIVRRENRVGFKAGNINNFLRGKIDYDFAVILDSDEIIPPYFIEESLKYFQVYPKTGILQANHISTRNRTSFMETFHIGVNSHWPNYQVVKNFFGFMSMLGHGAMISRNCFESCGGFPCVVAEDLCFSIEARKRGFDVLFAPNIICEEEYPIDYLAFRKRHSKWTQGNLEFIKKYTANIIKSDIKWFEKIDIFLFTYNLPLTAVFTLFLIINAAVLPLLSYTLIYPVWMMIPTVLFFISPMSNDLFTYIGKLNFFALLKYLFLCFFLYGSMFYTSFISSLKGIFGKKAVFIVTPKNSERISFFSAIRYCFKEIIFAIVLATTAILCAGDIAGILSVALLVVASLSSPFLCLLGNRQLQQDESLTPSRVILTSEGVELKLNSPKKRARKMAFLFKSESCQSFEEADVVENKAKYAASVKKV